MDGSQSIARESLGEVERLLQEDSALVQGVWGQAIWSVESGMPVVHVVAQLFADVDDELLASGLKGRAQCQVGHVVVQFTVGVDRTGLGVCWFQEKRDKCGIWESKKRGPVRSRVVGHVFGRVAGLAAPVHLGWSVLRWWWWCGARLAGSLVGFVVGHLDCNDLRCWVDDVPRNAVAASRYIREVIGVSLV
jgi:hypothetical protein